MAVDVGIYSNLLQRPKSVADYDAENIQNQSNSLNLQQARQAVSDQNALRSATQQFGNDSSANLAKLQQAGLYKQSQDYQASIEKSKLTGAQTANTTSEISSRQLGDKIKAHDFQLQKLSSVTDPQSLVNWAADGVQSGAFPLEQAQAAVSKALQQIQQPGGLDAWKQQALQGGMSAKDQLQQQLDAQRATETTRHNTASEGLTAANTAAHIQAANIAAGTSRANNAATIAKDYKVAGIDPQTGNFVGAGDGSGSGMAGMVDALGSYKLDPSQAFARMAPAMRAGVIAQVQQKYPDYDPTTYAAKTKAARDFTSGSQGNAMRSFAVAGQHLDQLNGLVDALNNKDTQAINRIGNYISEQTGNAAPTNFDAAKDVVSKEVVKAIVAGGGGVAERQELSELMSKAKSPAQLKGVIQQYRGLMSAQHDALLQQRRAAGLPDTTLPKYTDANGSPPAAPGGGWKYIGPVK